MPKQRSETRSLVVGGFTLQPNGLQVTGKPDLAKTMEAGATFDFMSRSYQWWVGDWLLFVDQHWGDHEQICLDALDRFSELPYSTLANWKSVAKCVPFSHRRENLSHTHHAVVADLEPEQQETLLKMAESESPDRPPRLSVAELRQQKRELLGRQPKPLQLTVVYERIDRAIDRIMERTQRQDKEAAGRHLAARGERIARDWGPKQRRLLK